MSAIARGSRNAFRSPLRTVSVIAILGISLGLVVVMLAARNAVNNRIAEVKSSVGNTVTVSPAGARGFIGGGEPLKQSQVDELTGLPHVARVNATIDSQLIIGTDTDLQTPIEPGTLGIRQGRLFQGAVRDESGGTTRSAPTETTDFKPPIFAIGTNNAAYGGTMLGNTLSISSGAAFDADSNENVALVGKALADKNSLTAGSTFTAYSTKITVSGIFDSGNEFSNNGVLFPLKTLQRLSGQTDQVTSIVVNVDSLDNLAATTATIKEKLSDTADVVSSEDTVKEAVKPLGNIRTIATTSLIGALVATTVIILLMMVMVVRERRKEIAVLKALGAGDPSIVTQFVTESVVLSLMGSFVGTALGVALSNPIMSMLVTSNADSPRGFNIDGGPPGGGNVVRFAVGGFEAVRGAVRDLNAAVNVELVLYGLLAAVVVAIIGSALPAWLIARVRPADVLRND